MTDIVYLNGDFLRRDQAMISVMDRGFLLGDGIYEVIPAYQGLLFRIEEHLDRLQRSLNAARIQMPIAREELHRLLETLIEKNNGGNLSVYLQITRGVGPIRDHEFPGEQVAPTVFAMCSPIQRPQSADVANARGAKAITFPDIRWLRCDIKSTSLMPNLLLRQQAIDAGALETILLRDGFVTEGAASNVFVVKDGDIMTSPKNNLILGGITRDLIIELARENGLACEELEVFEDVLRNADEIWCSSSTKEIVPIVELDGKPVGDGKVGPIWREMAGIYVAYKQSLFDIG